MLSFQSYFLQCAHYNQWANQQLFTALATLIHEQLTQPQPAYFDSILKLANHLWVGDTLWLGRMQGQATALYQLDSVVFNDFSALYQARQQLDDTLIQFIVGKTETQILSNIIYSRWGESLNEPLHNVLSHVFNHQTHHRGQLQQMFFSVTGQSLALDMIIFQRLCYASHTNI